MGKLRLRKYAQLYLMVLPTIAYFLIFSIYPIIQGVITSTQKPRLLGGGEYVGLANYAMYFRTGRFGKHSLTPLS